MIRKNLAICFSALLALSACDPLKVDYPEDVKEAMPVDMPVRAVTSFTPGLRCMDEMFIKYKVRPIRITAAQIPDFSESRGDAGFGAREMLISAISAMSQRSGALRFVAYDRSTPDIIALQSAHPRKKEFAVPDFFIRGAVTQIESSPYSKQAGHSLSADDLDFQELQSVQLSNSNSAALQSVGVDLNMGLINTFELLPGIFSSNSLTVEKRGNSDDVSLSIWKLGAIYTLNENRAKPLSDGLRALMEVGSIELFGKLYNLPYWECLAVLGEDSDLRSEARDLYEGMGSDARIEWVGNELARKGLLKMGTAFTRDDGTMSDELREAIGHYRVQQNMFANSLLTFELFDQLYRQKMMENKPVSEEVQPNAAVSAVESSDAPPPSGGVAKTN